MRRKRTEHARHAQSRGLPGFVPAPAALQVVLHQVGELHQGRDRRVEAKGIDIPRDAIDRLVQLASEVLRADLVRVGDRLVFFPHDQAPDPVQESGDAVDAAIVPFGVQLRWPDEELIDAGGVGAVALDQLVRRDAVALRLRHHGTVALDHPLREKRREWFVDGDHLGVVKGLHEEARIEQVQDRVLDAADVLVDRHPVVNLGLVEGQRLVVGVGVAQEVPRRIDEGIHGVGFATGRLAAARARGVDEFGRVREGVLAVGSKLDVVRQRHRKLVHGDRHDAVVRAVDHGDRHSPVALAGDQPISQPVDDGPLADASTFRLGGDLRRAIFHAQPAVRTGVDKETVVGLERRLEWFCGGRRRGTDDLANG